MVNCMIKVYMNVLLGRSDLTEYYGRECYRGLCRMHRSKIKVFTARSNGNNICIEKKWLTKEN